MSQAFGPLKSDRFTFEDRRMFVIGGIEFVEPCQFGFGQRRLDEAVELDRPRPGAAHPDPTSASSRRTATPSAERNLR